MAVMFKVIAVMLEVKVTLVVMLVMWQVSQAQMLGVIAFKIERFKRIPQIRKRLILRMQLKIITRTLTITPVKLNTRQYPKRQVISIHNKVNRKMKLIAICSLHRKHAPKTAKVTEMLPNKVYLAWPRQVQISPMTQHQNQI